MTRFANDGQISISDGSTGGNPADETDVLVTDWSGAALSFASGIGKAVSSVDVRPKILNEDFEKFALPALEDSIRRRIGAVITPSDAACAGEMVRSLVSHSGDLAPQFAALRKETIFNLGCSVTVGTEILSSLVKK
jgi:YidC/Oxa1 family membrane protein insertase